MALTIPEIEAVVKEMDTESKAMTKELFKLAWFMRGALSIEEAYQLDFESREIIAAIVKDNLEIAKETRMPFF